MTPPDPDAPADESDTRQAVLAHLEAGLDDLAEDIETALPTTPDEEKLQLRRYHELGYLANQYRKLKRDTDLVEMDRRLELLEVEADADDA